MSEILRNTLIVCGIFMVVIVRIAIDWVKETVRKH